MKEPTLLKYKMNSNLKENNLILLEILEVKVRTSIQWFHLWPKLHYQRTQNHNKFSCYCRMDVYWLTMHLESVNWTEHYISLDTTDWIVELCKIWPQIGLNGKVKLTKMTQDTRDKASMTETTSIIITYGSLSLSSTLTLNDHLHPKKKKKCFF